MQMAVKNFMVALLVCSFTLAESKECSQSQISYDNIKRSELKQNYEDGDTIKVNCATGYVGLYKITCDGGKWIFNSGRECKRRPCGHPGDAANADFRLIGYNEFVFGATVEYTCRTGYLMASRENHRNCRAQGWDNAVPVCEVVKCPTIRTSEEVIATGNTEEGSFDDVIHFECISPHKKLDRADNIHCTKDGTWSGPVPNCIEITCSPPNILRGMITNQKNKYQENELIEYTCVDGYKPTHGNPKCTKNDWSIKPDCEEIVCLLEFAIPGVQSTFPSGKNIFKPGEILTITCLKNYWIFRTRRNSETIKCQDNGEWERSLICNEITCDVPNYNYLQYPRRYFFGAQRLGAQKSYACIEGYKKTATYATCTTDGWDPKPLCEMITCPKPDINNAVIPTTADTYKLGDKITIKCSFGYEPDRFVITCNNDQQWENMQRCTIAEGACGKITLTNGFVHYSKDHDGSQYAFYTCDTDYKTFDNTWWGAITCQQGVWSYKPQCIRKDECGSVPSVKHGKQIQIHEASKDGQSFKFECDFGYKSRPSSIKCLKGEWENPVCERDRCDAPPEVENAVIIAYSRDEEGEQSVTFKCQKGLELHGHDTVFCINSHWEKKPTCKEKCTNPNQIIKNGVLMTSDHNKIYWEGDKVEYKCNEGFQFHGENIANCTQGTWIYPKCIDRTSVFQLNGTTLLVEKLLDKENSTCHGQNQTDPRCKDQTHGCSQPSSIPSTNLKEHYEEGETINYTCPSKMTPNTLLTCTQGNWIGHVTCLGSCNVTEEEMASNKIELKRSKSTTTHAKHGKSIYFKCIRGTSLKYNSVILTQQCKNGKITLPVCW